VRTALFASLALVLAGCGDPLFFAEVQDKQICMTMPSQTIHGTSVNPGVIGERTASWTGSLDLGSAIPGLGEKGTTGTIKTISLRVNSTTDMTVIRRADVKLAGADGQDPTAYMHYDAAEQTSPDPHVLTMTIDADIDLFTRLAGGKEIQYVIDFTGYPPENDWTADVTACMSATVKIDPLQKI
jgi:hypothetical protein